MNVAGRIFRCCKFGTVLCSCTRFTVSFHQGVSRETQTAATSHFICNKNVSKTLSSHSQASSCLRNFPKDESTLLTFSSVHNVKKEFVLSPAHNEFASIYNFSKAPPSHFGTSLFPTPFPDDVAERLSTLPAARRESVLPPACNRLPLLYISPFSIIEVRDPSAAIEICDAPGIEIEKKAERMLIIRRRKMKKHRRKKWHKKFKFVIIKRRFQQQQKREKEFQAVLISHIQAAETFSAEEYVKSSLKRISERPRPETKEEKRERIMDLMRKNRSNVWIIPPKIEDD